MIERHWKGITKPGEENNYIHHLRKEIFPGISAIHGFITATILTRKVEKGTEFLIVTQWDSLDAIKKFSGEDAEKAVVPERVRKIMVEYENVVSHYNVEDE
jgi:heme-degrading monooxygenase HmoA